MTTGRALLADEDGISMVEIMTSSSLVLIALTIFGAALLISNRTQIRDTEYSRANDSANLAVAMIDRQIRSGYVVATAPLGKAADAVKIFTLTAGQPQCVMWAVAPPFDPQDPLMAQGLYIHTWNPAIPNQKAPTEFSSAGGWRLITGDIVGADDNTFYIKDSLWIGNQKKDVFPTLEMILHLNASKGGVSRDGRAAQEIQVRSRFTSRNSQRAVDPFGAAGAKTGTTC